MTLMPRPQFLVAIGGLLAMLLASGCQFIDNDRVRDDSTETIPWNNRADWEGGSLGAPF